MFVRKAFQFRLRPTKAQAKLLQAQLDECRSVYNELLSERKMAHKELDISLSKYKQLMFLPILKEERASLRDVTFSCEVKAVLLEPKTEAIGLDVGLESFATLWNGKKIGNPRFFKRGEKALAKAQRKLSKLQKSTKERRKSGKAVGKIDEQIKNQRKDFCHKQSRKIVDEYQSICIEDLNFKNMIEGSDFAKSIPDASWNQFCQFLSYKGAEAGRKLGVVDLAHTSQVCSQCGHLKPKELAERKHKCFQFGYTAHRDFNAGRNILALGLDGLGEIPRSLRL